MHAHRVEPLNFNNRTKYCVLTYYNGEDYIFRYAYNTLARAVEVSQNLERGNRNCDIITNLAYNYFRYPDKFDFGGKTTAQDYWHVIKLENES